MKAQNNLLKFDLSAWFLLLVLALIPACGSNGGGGGGGGGGEFRFVDIPEYGTTANLRGHAGSYNPDDYMVAVYIRVEGGWWTKPTFASPLTSIDSDGSWTCDITTGGNDIYANEIAAFLLPIGINAPRSSGSTQLPDIPEAVESITFNRLAEAREISFAGLDWTVKRTDFQAGPGPNYFSDDYDKIWTDSEGLHLTISYDDGAWYCTEVIANETFGYGTYIFQTRGRVDILDLNMVFGAFTWNTDDPDHNYTEIDAVEYARWGNANEHTNGQFVVHPCSGCPGCSNCERFRVDLTDKDSNLTHYMIWEEGRVEFRVYYGQHLGDVPPASDLVHQWTFTGDDVPAPSGENFRFNFWLVNGWAPIYSQGDEVIVTDFLWQKEAPEFEDPEDPIVTITNLPDYPIMDYAEGAEDVTINGVPVDILDAYYGYRQDVVLEPGSNIFDIVVVGSENANETTTLEVVYDPGASTEDSTLLYKWNDTANETMIIDLDNGCILGLIPGAKIVNATHDGQYVVDTNGNIYQTYDHTVVGLPLPFSGSVYPVFSLDDVYCYAGTKKARLDDQTLVSDQFPVNVDNRYATVTPGNILVQANGLTFSKVDLENDEVISEVNLSKQRVLWGTSTPDPNGQFGFVTSYSYAVGTLDVGNLETGEIVYQLGGISDYMAQTAFSSDSMTAFVGGYGNSYYGEGGIEIIDMTNFTHLSYYEQYGAYAVVVGPNDLVYVSTIYIDHFGTGSVTQGSKDKRGIDVLEFDGDHLSPIKSYYLKNNEGYRTKPTFFIKPGLNP